MRPGKRAPLGTRISIRDSPSSTTNQNAVVTATNDEGHRWLRFDGPANILTVLDKNGEVPLPPYIRRSEQIESDRERYQTVFAQPPGSVAAPTAGLHFTDALLNQLRDRGVEIHFLTLHVGLWNFVSGQS